jgi:hypothetical protein
MFYWDVLAMYGDTPKDFIRPQARYGDLNDPGLNAATEQIIHRMSDKDRQRAVKLLLAAMRFAEKGISNPNRQIECTKSLIGRMIWAAIGRLAPLLGWPRCLTDVKVLGRFWSALHGQRRRWLNRPFPHWQSPLWVRTRVRGGCGLARRCLSMGKANVR